MPKMRRITAEEVIAMKPCYSEEEIRKNHGKDGLTLNGLWKLDISYEHRWWVILKLIPKDQLRFAMADIAESVLHIFEKKYPNDSRPRKAIEVARNMNATQEERYAAYAAAHAAAADAADAADAAYAAYATAATYAATYAADAADATDATDAAYAAYAATYAADTAVYAARAAYATDATAYAPQWDLNFKIAKKYIPNTGATEYLQ